MKELSRVIGNSEISIICIKSAGETKILCRRHDLCYKALEVHDLYNYGLHA